MSGGGDSPCKNSPSGSTTVTPHDLGADGPVRPPSLRFPSTDEAGTDLPSKQHASEVQTLLRGGQVIGPASLNGTRQLYAVHSFLKVLWGQKTKDARKMVYFRAMHGPYGDELRNRIQHYLVGGGKKTVPCMSEDGLAFLLAVFKLQSQKPKRKKKGTQEKKKRLSKADRAAAKTARLKARLARLEATMETLKNSIHQS